MRLPEISVRNPVMTVMIFFAIILLGAVALTKLKIDLLPDIEPPQVSVLTFWPGASATDVESDVTKYIEDQLTTVNNLDRLTSKSLDNLSVINCRFEWGTDLDVATNDVRDALELAKRDLPEDIEKPFIFRFTSATMPVLAMFVTADESYPQLYHIVDKQIADELKRVPGVGAIVLYGGLKRQINVHFDLHRIEAYNLSLAQIRQVLAAENLNLPAGEIKLGSQAYAIRIPGRYQSVEEIGDTVIGNHQGRPIYLKDVAQVTDSFKEVTLMGWGDSKPAVVLLIQKQTGINTVEVIDRIKEKLKEIKGGLPGDIKMGIVMDTSEFIRWSIDNLKESLYIGIFLVIVVTFLFLRRLWGSVIILLTIPFSLIACFILMLIFEFTINTVTLMALVIASGVVVDNAIVILENITRHVERGAKPAPAAIYGSSEVGLAVAASTFTIVAVFIPLMFITGLTGIIFKQLAFVIVVAIMASLFISLTLPPMLASKVLRPARGIRKGGTVGRVNEALERGFSRVEEVYGRLLAWSLGNKKKVIAFSLSLFAASMAFIPVIGTELVPDMDSGDINIFLRLPEGTRIEETHKVMERINSYFRQYVPEARHYYAFDGQTEKGMGVVLGFEEGPNVGEVGAKLVRKRERERSTKEVAMMLREKIEEIPGIGNLTVSATAPIKSVFMGGMKRISIEVWGYNMEKTGAIAKEIKGIVEKVPGATDVALSQKPPRPELWVDIDRKKASSLGVNVAMVASVVRTSFYGDDPTEFRDAGEDYDIFLRLGDRDKNRIASLLEVPIPTLLGNQVRLGNIARVREGYGPVEIERRNRQRIVKVEANTFGRPLGDVVRDIEKGIAQIRVPEDVKVRFGGETEEQQKAFRDLGLLFVLGIILVYMVMASQFKSFLHPFVIMFSLPFAVTGVILIFLLTGTTLSLFSYLGLIMLMGIVVKNAIVLVDYVNILRERGLSLFDAITTGGANRLRPVLMTTLTTFFGMLPMALSRGEGSEIWNPLGLTMIGGLIVSTLVTLILVPVIYSIFEARSFKEISGRSR
ncbi:MAG: efflux RND transporter permease subunit [Deltaproteobacteria bacterium]|nr:efflux RND transporter permease subunit [Deltaproteobacteria bacterium]